MTSVDQTETSVVLAAVLRERRKARRARQLAELLRRRPDLAGVHPPTDLATELTRWSA